jgi:hypothetical protein
MNTKAKVPSVETGASQRGDGKSTSIKWAEGPMRDPLAGRHAVNSSGAEPGTVRGGQSEPSGNRPVTGVPKSAPIRSMVPIPSIPANQAETSKDLEARLLAPPQPFTYDTLAATLPTGHHDGSTEGVPYNVMTDVNAEPQRLAGTHVGCANTGETNWAASGDSKPGGYNSINSGFPTRGNQRQAGKPGKSNQGTSARENARVRQTGY